MTGAQLDLAQAGTTPTRGAGRKVLVAQDTSSLYRKASALHAHLEPADEVEVLLHVGGQHKVYDGGAQRLAQGGRRILQAAEVELPSCLTALGLGA